MITYIAKRPHREKGVHAMSYSMGGGISSESQIRAQAKYDAQYTKRVSLKLNIRTDKDIIRWLWGQRSMQGSIKRLIREDIARSEASQE